MSKKFFVKDAAAFGDKPAVVTSFFLVTAYQVRSKKNSDLPYLQLTLSDHSGQIEARMWDNVEAKLNTFGVGDCVKVEGEVNKYNGKHQVTVRQIRKAVASDAELYDAGDFLPTTTRDVEQMWGELRGVVASLRDANLRGLLDSILDDSEIAKELRQAPAAKALHHAWIGGLLEHIVCLLALAESVLPHYPLVNRDLLLTGVVLHDIGKLQELTYGNCFAYSMEGQLLGHITIGLRMVQQRIEALPAFPQRLRLLVEHMILSHHGKLEFGSPKLPMIREAVMLNMLDDLDAKMQLMQSEFQKHTDAGNDGAKMTDWVRAMERPILDTRQFLDEPGVPAPVEDCPPELVDAISTKD